MSCCWPCSACWLGEGLQEVNGVKNALSLLINTVALVAFALFGPVQSSAVVVMALARLTGYGGALVARRLNATALRATVVVFGTVVALVLLVRG